MPWYSWNIAESGVKHNISNQIIILLLTHMNGSINAIAKIQNNVISSFRIYFFAFSLCIYWNRIMVRVMVFYSTFTNISCISRWSNFLVEEPGVPGEDHWPDKLYHRMLYISSTPQLSENRTHNLVLMGTVYIGRIKSNYHMITTTTAPVILGTITNTL